MRLIKGKQYGKWTLVDIGESDKPVSCCHLCGKYRRKFYRFERYNANGDMVEFTELGTECINRFDFDQANPYTNKQGVNTSLKERG